MRFGYGLPTQQRLALPPLPSGGEADAFCWDLRCMWIDGADCLYAVHTLTRYMVFLWSPPASAPALHGALAAAIAQQFQADHFPAALVECYFSADRETADTGLHSPYRGDEWERLADLLGRQKWGGQELAASLNAGNSGMQALLEELAGCR